MILKLKLIGFILLMFSLNALAANDIQTVKDLRELKQQVETSNLPVLLLFSAEDCGYCDAVRDNYLVPMIKTGEYSSTILFRQLYIDDYHYLRNEKGEIISAETMALKYDIEVTPSILFINAQGNELSERIIGINSVDYFDELLSTHISQANRAMAETK